MKILVLDNYDSFTYNLVQYIQDLTGQKIDVVRNDAIELDDVAAYDVIVLSPGPGIPAEAGIMLPIIRRYAAEKPILGVCLGHQAIGEAFGADLENLDQVYHGIETPIKVIDDQDPLFQEVADVFQAGRYHSWVIQKDSLPADLKITAIDVKGEVMAMRHRTHPIFGVQFHPESVMTAAGKQMLTNFLLHCGVKLVEDQVIMG